MAISDLIGLQVGISSAKAQDKLGPKINSSLTRGMNRRWVDRTLVIASFPSSKQAVIRKVKAKLLVWAMLTKRRCLVKYNVRYDDKNRISLCLYRNVRIGVEAGARESDRLAGPCLHGRDAAGAKGECPAPPVRARGTGALEQNSDRKWAEEFLKTAFSLHRAILESTAEGILVVSNDWKIITYNRKFLEMWHIPESIMASKDDKQVLAFVLDQS